MGSLANPWPLREAGPDYGQKVATSEERSELKLEKQ